MANSLNLSLTDELRRYVDAQASDDDVYATPSEYIRDLIRRDMGDWVIVRDVAQGLREARAGEFAPEGYPGHPQRIVVLAALTRSFTPFRI